LVRQCVAETGTGLWIIFDSWSSLLRPGEGGETTGQIAPVYSRIRRLIDLGATATVIDHPKKYDPGTIYGGLDKEAKVDSIHSMRLFENQVRPENPIVRVDSWLKRFSPKGVGSFAFEVRNRRDKKGGWHFSDLQPVQDPVEAAARRNREILRDLIRKNTGLGQQALAKLASEAGDFSRDEAAKILQEGISKYWTAHRGAHGKLCYQLL
jgi:hypothetical protein